MLAAYASSKTSNKSAAKANFPSVNHSNWPRCFCLKWNKGQCKHFFFFNGPMGSVTSVRTAMIHPQSRANCLCCYSWIQQRSLSWADSFQLWLCWLMSVVGVLICRTTLKPGHQQQQQNSAACLLTSTSKKVKTYRSISENLPGSLLTNIAVFVFGVLWACSQPLQSSWGSSSAIVSWYGWQWSCASTTGWHPWLWAELSQQGLLRWWSAGSPHCLQCRAVLQRSSGSSWHCHFISKACHLRFHGSGSHEGVHFQLMFKKSDHPYCIVISISSSLFACAIFFFSHSVIGRFLSHLWVHIFVVIYSKFSNKPLPIVGILYHH